MSNPSQRGKQARRSGPTRGAARSAQFQHEMTRYVTDERPTTPAGRSEALVEAKRKAYIAALGRDQRITQNKRAVYSHWRSFSVVLAEHLKRWHDVDMPAKNDHGTHQAWVLDKEHERLHGRAS